MTNLQNMSLLDAANKLKLNYSTAKASIRKAQQLLKTKSKKI